MTMRGIVHKAGHVPLGSFDRDFAKLADVELLKRRRR